MNTPAHVAASALCWRDETGWSAACAIGCGALLPDAPMFGFYGYERWIAHRSESEIWSELYFQVDWQLLFDLFNSIPLGILLLVICRVCGFRLGVLLSASLILHLVCDLPLHHDDAHCHFLPFTNWRFLSPISYWDPRHYGSYFLWVEVVFTLAACSYVAWRTGPLPMRVLAAITLLFYLAGVALAVMLWVV